MSPNNNKTLIESNNTFMLKIEDLVREIVTQNSTPYYRIESGIEHHVHAEGENMYLPVIRIVTYFEDTVGKIAELLQDEFDMVVERSVDKKKNKIDSFSYKHVNYIASLKSNRRDLIEYKRTADRKFEIQVCSMLHDAWAGMKKELGFEDEAFPEEARRDLFRVGALLEMADMEFLKIKGHLSKSAAAHEVVSQPEVIVAEVTPAIVEEIVAQPEVVAEVIPEPVAETIPEPVAEITPEPEVVQEVKAEPVVAHEEVVAEAAPQQVEETTGMNVNANGTMETMPEAIVENTVPFFEDRIVKDELKINKPALIDENAQMTDSSLKEYVSKSKLLKEIDGEIAERAGAKINPEIDIEGDVERLRFLKVHTLRQLHDRLSDNRNEIVAFAEKWIGKDNGGTFDSGISLFYLEYLLVGKKNDPAFAVEYVVKFISDNDYSARYIIPTYNSIKSVDATNYSHLTLKA